MKLSGWLLRIALITVVVISGVFSWLILQNPSRLERQDTSTVQTTVPIKTNATQENSVYLPTSAYYQGDAQKQFLTVATHDIVSQLQQELKGSRMGPIQSNTKLSTAAYNALITSKNSLQLVYADSVPFALFNGRFFKKALSTKTNFQFNRILIRTQTAAQIILVNDKTRQIYTARLRGVDTKKLMAVIKKGQTAGLPMTEQRFKNREVAMFTEPVSVRPYAYLLDRQSANHYISSLLTAQARGSVDARELGNETVYTAGTTHRLTTNAATGAMQYENTAMPDPPKAQDKLFTETFKALAQLDLPSVTTMRYFALDPVAHAVTYRSFVQSFPIFNQTENGTVKVTYNDTALQVDFSSDNVTVPIPTDQSAVKLPSTVDLLAQLNAAGYANNKINNIVLGYQWMKQSATDLVVDLQPAYYVEINGVYKQANDWLKNTSEEG